VAEPFRRQPAELLYMGSTPIPSSMLAHIDFQQYLRQNIRECTAETYLKRLNRLAKIGNLANPEQIKNLICAYQSTESYKELLTNAFDYWVKFRGLTWNKPKFTREEKPIFISLESELNALIAKPRLKMSSFLQLLKETGVDSGEAWKLRWTDINAERLTIDVRPTKNHNARTLPITANLLSRLFQLPRSQERVFACKSLDGFRAGYEVLKDNLAIEFLGRILLKP
jgi:integrase